MKRYMVGLAAVVAGLTLTPGAGAVPLGPGGCGAGGPSDSSCKFNGGSGFGGGYTGWSTGGVTLTHKSKRVATDAAGCVTGFKTVTVTDAQAAPMQQSWYSYSFAFRAGVTYTLAVKGSGGAMAGVVPPGGAAAAEPTTDTPTDDTGGHGVGECGLAPNQ